MSQYIILNVKQIDKSLLKNIKIVTCVCVCATNVFKCILDIKKRRQ